MNSKKITWLVVVRIVFALFLLALGIWLFTVGKMYSSIFIGLLFLLVIIDLFKLLYDYFNQIDKVILSMLYDDYTIDLKRTSHDHTYNHLVDLFEKNKEKEANRASETLIFNQLLNGIDSGILILKGEHVDREVILVNQYFKNYFDLPNLTDWRFLKPFIPAFCQVIEERNFTEFKTTLDIQVDKKERQTFVVQTSLSKIHGETYYIILLDSIQRVIDSKENEAWISIMKIISHELMNSLAPIHALAYNIQEISKQEDISEEDKEDIQTSVSTIINRSNHLQEFVERYRKLTMLPTPQKKKENLAQVVDQVLQNFLLLAKSKGIDLKTSIPEGIDFLVDVSQFEQVLINLMTNSLYAVENAEKKEIAIASYLQQNRLYIELSDTGTLVDTEIVKKIFLPFYTTRKNGAGIGLTLSKSIMEAHKGYLFYQQKEEKNVLVMVFVL
ncbi:sensor histidine kinase [Sphingobacterium hungaricum]|uniref:histidine kinase n=1 Tax=Sphingobacterium hungaricum TaxID=2082723 RepID=A0A928YSA1_9SPHI|nr:ATP-binding protein [Sphingobacterium hungaricum]MBE8715035.1 ATP-binding protein [Sphingobacterium hungaricum]